MKKLITLVPLVAVLTTVVLFGVADSAASIADASVADNEVGATVDMSANTNSYANATIRITMRTLPLPEE